MTFPAFTTVTWRTTLVTRNSTLRVVAASFWFALFAAVLPAARSVADEPQLGVAAERPSSGPTVKIRGGYMTAYAETIPGTEILFEMMPIPGGRFRLGSPTNETGHSRSEGPQVTIEVPAMWVGKCEVTWGEYREFMRLCDVFEKFDDARMRQLTDENRVDGVTSPSKLYEPNFTYASGDEPTLPAVTMSQYAAKQYTKWLSLLTGEFYRLPTEAEWECACRAGKEAAYGFGSAADQLDEHAWFAANSGGVSHPVCQKRPNAWGLYDMHGNASEWVLDAFEARWYRKLEDGIAADKAVNWPDRLYPRVLRGGSYQMDAEDCRSASRRQSDDDAWRSYDPNTPQSPWWFASDEAQDVGFRIVRPLAAPHADDRGKYWDADVEMVQRAVDFRIDKEGRGRRGLVDPDLPAAAASAEAAGDHSSND
jgi:sulfatase modifying factor 1